MEEVTVIIPTWEEASNVDPLVSRLRQALRDRTSCVLFVDDSPTEDTAIAVTAAADTYACSTFQVLVQRRIGDQSWGGLGGAVTDGLQLTATPLAVVMDADLQHPPELLPDMLDVLENGVDLVVGSRYCEGGSSDGLHSGLRVAVSRASTYVAKLLFPRQLRGISDPMTGLYALRLSAINAAQLQPKGFKILLETLVRHKGLRTAEVPLQFAARHSGTSKADTAKGIEYLRQLGRLRWSAWRSSRFLTSFERGSSQIGLHTRRVINFALGGGLVAMIGLLLLYGQVHYLGVGKNAAFAVQLAVTLALNFAFNQLWTWRDVPSALIGGRIGRFLFTRGMSLGLSMVLFAFLTAPLIHLQYLAANVVCLIVSTAVNYYTSNRFVFVGSPA